MNPLQDITLDHLFRPTKIIELFGQSVQVRALSDPERSERYRKAMLARARASEKLVDPKSDEYAIHFGNISSATDDEVKGAIKLFRMRELMVEAEKEIPFEFIPIPDEASVEETQSVVLRREESVKKVRLARDTFVNERMVEYDKALAEYSRDILEEKYCKAIRERVLDTVYGEEVVAYTIYLSTEKRFSVSDAANLSAAAKDKIWDAIQEVDNIDPLLLSGTALTGSSPVRTV